MTVTLTGLAALFAGVALAPGTGDGDRAPFQSAVTLAAQGAGAGCTNPDDPRCYVIDEETQPGNGNGGGGNSGGGGGGCYWYGSQGGDDYLEASDERSPGVRLVLVAAQSGGIEIPCVRPEGFYLDGCYWGTPPLIAQLPAPPEGKVEGEDGQTLYATCIASVSGSMPDPDIQWSPLAVMITAWFDFAEIPTITPEEVALILLARINLEGVHFALAPPETGAGVVGLPVWLGVDETTTSWGPHSDDDCIDGVCVTITAQVTEVTWDMGDGTTFTCARDQHRAWTSGQNFRDPGNNCHHYYQRASRGQPDRRYQITATSHWTVEWTAQASDASGTLTTEASASVGMQIDEIQVLTER